jgi:protein involved in polysaccharide export with SLBB domain
MGSESLTKRNPSQTAGGISAALGRAAAAAFFILLAGCAQNAAYEPAPAGGRSRSEGVSSGVKAMAVVIADVDGDGRLDVVGGAADPGSLSISYGDGRGGLSAPQSLSVEGDVRSLAVADINEDGRPDILFSVQRQSSGIRLWRNRSGRSWELEKGPIEINKYEGIRAVDLNGDGHMDVVAANATSDYQAGIQVWFGNGRGGWTPGVSPTVTGMFMDVALADFNADGVLDVAGAGWGVHGALRVWLGTPGAGGWTALAPVAAGNFYSVNVADVNADGFPDLVAGTYKSGVRLFLGDGRGGFVESLRPEFKGLAEDSSGEGPSTGGQTEEASFWEALPVDVDGDGRMDIVASSLDYRGVQVWLNRADKSWKPFAAGFPRSGTYYGLDAADVDGDGRPDICGAHFGEGIKIWSGRPRGPAADRTPSTKPASEVGSLKAESGPRENRVFKTANGVPEYKIGPGDTLEITFWEGNTPMRQDLLVRPDGRVSFGMVENLPVEGLTASELDAQLTARLGQYFKKPRIDVRVKAYESRTVRVMGALQRSGVIGSGTGEYKLLGKTTVLEILTRAGGPAPDADLKSVRIRRQDGESISLNLYKTIIQGDISQDMVLDDGDLVYLPTLSKETNRIYVFGEVQKPGAYSFSGSEMRLIDAVSEAGGITAFAQQSETVVVRGDITQPEIINSDLKRLLEKGDRSQNILLASGDMVYVPRSGFGEIKLFNDRIRPLLELILWPARVVIDWNSAADITGVK